MLVEYSFLIVLGKSMMIMVEAAIVGSLSFNDIELCKRSGVYNVGLGVVKYQVYSIIKEQLQYI